jgi:hypothetical protein
MKRKVLLVAAVVTASFTFAQDDAAVNKSFTSKNGHEVLPQAGEYALGFSLDPLLNALGTANGGPAAANTMSGTIAYPGLPAGFTALAGAATPISNVTIWGKMFKDAETAYRGKLRIGFGSETMKNDVADNAPNAPAGSMVTDETSYSYYNITLGAGLEKRRGSARVQGIYGAEASIGFSGASAENTYGNSLANSGGGARDVTAQSATNVTFGARGFAGIEYFIAPKISLGAEYGWGLSFTSTGGTEITQEGTGATTTTTPSGSKFALDTDYNNQASISILFHF